jgi:hypothetical protein
VIVALTKAQALRRTGTRIDNRARQLSDAIADWLASLAQIEAARAARDPHGYVGRVAKADRRSGPEAALLRLIERFGMRASAEAAGEVAGRSPSGLLEDALSRRPSVRFFAELRDSIRRRARAIVVESVERAERSVSRILLEASREIVTPSTGDIARRIRAAFVSGGSYAFSPERAAVIARTQITEAENTGQVAGYEILGVETILWLAYDDGRSGDRHHERMLRHAPVKLGEHFTLPDGARMRWPGDPLGPVRHKVNCRCSTKPGPMSKRPWRRPDR